MIALAYLLKEYKYINKSQIQYNEILKVFGGNIDEL